MNKKQRDFLIEHGWVVIPKVVEEKVCDETRRQLYSFLFNYNKSLKIDGPAEAWHDLNNLPPGTLHGGMNRCAGHLPALWTIRQHPGVARVFAELYGVEATELATSMDAWTVWNAKAVTPKMRDKIWLHVDQGGQGMPPWPLLDGVQDEYKDGSIDISGFECVQGYVTLEDADQEEDGGLYVIDKGHTLHKNYFLQNPQRTKNVCNWHKFKPAYLDSLDETHFPRHAVKASKGDMVLWYSKTPHQGRPPTNRGHNRAVVYVCQAPKALLTPNDVAVRKEAWETGRMTSHWPVVHAECFKFATLHPGRPKVALSPLGRSLLGFDEEGDEKEGGEGEVKEKASLSKEKASEGSASACPPIDLAQMRDCRELNVFGMEYLKQELQRVGLKCGGSLEQRSERLFRLKDKILDQIPQKHHAKNAKKKAQ